MGLVFFFTFTAYLTIQAFATDMYGETLASNMATALYLSFTLSCFGSPAVVNQVGARDSMLAGILGYGCLVAASLAYFLDGERGGEAGGLGWLVVLGGGCCGVGAALLWTAQGRLIMEYSSGEDSGRLFSVFWALFNLSALAGGLLTFFYFSSSEGTGNALLYSVFLGFVLCGAASTRLLVSPSQLLRASPEAGDALPLLAEEESGGGGRAELKGGEERGWREEMGATVAFFGTRRMLLLSPIFFYTG